MIFSGMVGGFRGNVDFYSFDMTDRRFVDATQPKKRDFRLIWAYDSRYAPSRFGHVTLRHTSDVLPSTKEIR